MKEITKIRFKNWLINILVGLLLVVLFYALLFLMWKGSTV